MSRILIITPCPTHPSIEANSCRIANLMEILRRLGHEPHMLYLPHYLFGLPDIPAMQEKWKERLHVGRPHWAWLPGSIRNAVLLRRELLMDLPSFRHGGISGQGRTGFDRLTRPRWVRQARQLWEEYRFEVVILEYIMLSAILPAFPDSVLKLIDTHDVFAGRKQRIRHIPWRQRWFGTTREGEAAALARADAIIAIQEAEAAHFRALTSNPVVTVGHLVIRLTPAGEPAGAPSVLMVSSQNPINVYGLTLFLEEAWPLVRAALPDARLRLVGKICDGIPGNRPGLERLGVIPDLAAAYAHGHVVLNPVMEGTGLPTKSIEAMLHGKAMVSTPCGARSLGDGAGSAFLVGETPGEMAAHLVRLLRDAEARGNLAAAALRYAGRYNEAQIRNLQLAVSLPVLTGSREVASWTKPESV